MKAYQEAYLDLLRSAAQEPPLAPEALGAEAFLDAVRKRDERIARRCAEGTQLLRGGLFPTLDNIMTASREEVDELSGFAAELASGATADVGLNFRIHLALTSYARQKKLRDMLIRELYQLGMALFNLETTLSPNHVRLYSARMRMCFSEAASYFETEYDDITDPETRGYIHRSMGNIALSYESIEHESARAKLRAIERSIRVISDPDVRAKTPSLPWELYLYKSHQERTTMLAYLRSGNADADVFAQVLESALIVQQRQTRAARERGEPLQPRWQYAYLAARYHCGAMLLGELLDGLYALSSARPDDDFDYQSLFCHVSIPALFMEYAKELPDERERRKLAPRLKRMLNRLFPWLVRLPRGSGDISFALRQFLYAYLDLPGCPSFLEAAQNVFAARLPDSYAQMWITGQLARLLCGWAIEDCPERLAGLCGCADAGDVVRGREALLDCAALAGLLCNIGMIHFLNVGAASCRGLFEEEQNLLQLHAYCGAELLASHETTALCADVAYGHHCHYDEKGGYPLGFSPRSSPARAMIYLVAAASALAEAADGTGDRFDRIYANLCEGASTVYAPFAVDLLRDPARREQLRERLCRWSRESCEVLFRRQRAMLDAADEVPPKV